jgi:diguanylate cyclase (GGDEF)-like protein
VIQIVGAAQDITSRKTAEAELEFQAYHDPLTGLPNRALFADRLDQALARARRRRQPLAVLYTDLDHLKRVNDTLGHSVGDQLLRQAAERFRSSVRAEDTVARFGGDEFVILLGHVPDPRVAIRVAETLVARMNEPMRVSGHTLRVTTSVGLSFWPADGDDAETLLKHADNALYQAKAQGRDTYRTFTSEMNAKVQRRLALEQALFRAMPENRLALAYQPQHSLQGDGGVIGFEALLRWRDPTLGEVSPANFIPLAEDMRLIQPLGDWVLDRAVDDARQFRANARIAVNVSAVQLRDPDFPRRVRAILLRRDFPSERLELELTESATISEDDTILGCLSDLRSQGVRIAVDDFGTGYASLAYLRRLSVDVVKIDKSFIAGVGEAPADSAIVLGILGMAHGLGLSAVAEGVELETQRDFLSVAGCDAAQGFWFSPPRALEDLSF